MIEKSKRIFIYPPIDSDRKCYFELNQRSWHGQVWLAHPGIITSVKASDLNVTFQQQVNLEFSCAGHEPVQGSFCGCAQPVRDDATLYCHPQNDPCRDCPAAAAAHPTHDTVLTQFLRRISAEHVFYRRTNFFLSCWKQFIYFMVIFIRKHHIHKYDQIVTG